MVAAFVAAAAEEEVLVLVLVLETAIVTAKEQG